MQVCVVHTVLAQQILVCLYHNLHHQCGHDLVSPLTPCMVSDQWLPSPNPLLYPLPYILLVSSYHWLQTTTTYTTVIAMVVLVVPFSHPPPSLYFTPHNLLWKSQVDVKFYSQALYLYMYYLTDSWTESMLAPDLLSVKIAYLRKPSYLCGVWCCVGPRVTVFDQFLEGNTRWNARVL